MVLIRLVMPNTSQNVIYCKDTGVYLLQSGIDRIDNAKYITKCDLLKGYWCVPLTERAKEISVFVTPDGLY